MKAADTTHWIGLQRQKEQGHKKRKNNNRGLKSTWIFFFPPKWFSEIPHLLCYCKLVNQSVKCPARDSWRCYRALFRLTVNHWTLSLYCWCSRLVVAQILYSFKGLSTVRSITADKSRWYSTGTSCLFASTSRGTPSRDSLLIIFSERQKLIHFTQSTGKQICINNVSTFKGKQNCNKLFMRTNGWCLNSNTFNKILSNIW